MSGKMPLVAPVFLPGTEPLPPGMTEDDRAQMKQMLKYQQFGAHAMESCVVKSAISGVLGFGLGAFFSMMSSSFAIDDPLRQTMMQQAEAERVKNAAAKQSTSVTPANAAPLNGGKGATEASLAQATKALPTQAATAHTSAPAGAGATAVSNRTPFGLFKNLPPAPPQLPEVNTMAQTKQYFADMGKNMWRSGKGFGKVGALYSGVECVIEGYRARNDIWNPVAAGFVSGAILARKSGPQAVVGGGMAFAAFSGLIDLLYVCVIEWLLTRQPAPRKGRRGLSGTT